MKTQEAVMPENNNNEIPMWFVYNSDDEFDVRATLEAVPEKLDKNFDFFRDVPEWFETGEDILDEMRNALTEIKNMPEEERKRYTQEEIQTMIAAFEQMIACNEMMSNPELSVNQKEVLRCICYWFSLEAMHSVPLKPEDPDDSF